MEKPVRTFLQTTFILFALGIFVQAQPALVTEVPDGSRNLVKIGEFVYFTSGDSLLRTDGTAAGTIFLKSGIFSSPGSFTGFNGMAYFTSSPDPANVNSPLKELWRSDGTPSGTILLKTSSEYDLQILRGAGDFLFFRATDSATGHELYRTNGTAAGTMLVKDINPGSADGFSGSAAAVGNSLLFAADDGTNGAELWKSDGSSGGTVMIKDINPGASDGFGTSPFQFLPFTVFSYNNQFYFTGITPENGTEPWVSDGSAAGTTILQDIVPGPESRGRIQHTIAHNGVLYFIVFPDTILYPSSPRDLWKTAGTMASTVKVKTLGDEDSEHSYHPFLIYNDKVHFFDNNSVVSVLWVTDGTETGTFPFFSLDTHEGGVNYFAEVNDYLLFTSSQQSIPNPLFRSDGTNQGTQEITQFESKWFVSDDRHITQVDLTTVNDYAFYTDHDGPEDGYEKHNRLRS